MISLLGGHTAGAGNPCDRRDCREQPLLGKATSVVDLMSCAPSLHNPTQPMLLFWLQLVDMTLEYLQYLQYHRQQEIKEMIGLGV